MGRVSGVGLWRHRDFLRLWAAHTVSRFGASVSFVALPLVAVATLGASTLEIGFMHALGSLPALVLGLFAGVWVDRWRRRPVLIWADVGRAVVLGTVPLAAVLGVLGLGQLYVVVFVLGTLTLFFDVAHRSYLPSLVRRAQLMDGNGKLEVSRSAAEIGGPGLAGWLVQVLSAPLALLVDAVSFLASAGFLAGIGTVEVREQGGGGARGGRMLAEAVEGARLTFGDATLRALVLCTGTISFFNAAIEAVLIVYLVRELGLSAATIGIIFSIGGLGFLVGALLAGRITTRVPLGMVLICGPLMVGVADLLIPLAGFSPTLSVVLPCAAQFLFGVGLPIYRVNEVSLRQSITPDAFLGRVNSGEYFVREGAIPFGALLGGVMGELVGLKGTLAFAALGEASALLWIVSSPARSLRGHA